MNDTEGRLSVKPIRYVCNVCIGAGCMMCGGEDLKFRHEYGASGQHRIAANHVLSDAGWVYGEWVGYQAIAQLTVNQQRYLAFTRYWDGTFESDKVYRFVSSGAEIVEP